MLLNCIGRRGRPKTDQLNKGDGVAASEGRQTHVRPKTETTADLKDFANWLRNVGEHDRIGCAHLKVLYAEFALLTDAVPLSEGRFFRGLKGAGIHRYREGGGDRRWFYRVRVSRGELKELLQLAA